MEAFSDNKKKSDFLAKFACDVKDLNNDNYYVSNIKLSKFNDGSVTSTDNLLYIDNDWLVKNIDNYTNSEIENIYDKSGNFYTFVLNQARRRLESTTCITSENNAKFKIDGITESWGEEIGKTYQIKTVRKRLQIVN